MTGVTAPSLRIKLWLASAVICVGLYGLRSTHLPRRTAVGVEHRLIAGSGCSVVPEPGGRGWLVGAPEPPTNATTLVEGLLCRVAWPGGYASARQLTPFLEGGTWALQPLGLRQVWRLRATTVTQDRYLWTQSPAHFALLADSSAPQVFDYRSSRVLRWAKTEHLLRSQPTPVGFQEVLEESFSGGVSDLSEEAAGLEGIDSELTYSLTLTCGDRGGRLWWGEEQGGGLYAISEEPTPKVLRITTGAAPRALSADGKTLFFERDHGLWRLEFHRPLPELLEEVSLPSLPEPQL